MSERKAAARVTPHYVDHIGLWREELRAWAPETIFDAHVHLGPAEVMGPLTAERRQEGLGAFTHLPWEELSEFYGDLYSGKTVAGLIAFPFPLREVNLEAANDYIIGLMRREPSDSAGPRVRGFLLSHPTETHRAVRAYEKSLAAGVPFRGVKPYYDLLGKSNYRTTMPEFLPEDLLEFMNDKGLVMMLHTSGVGVGDRDNQKYLRSVATRFPCVKVILAHAGRYLDPRQFFDFMDSGVLEECPSLFLDTSYAACREVYECVLTRPSLWSRLLFGSDVPWGFTTGVERWYEGHGFVYLARDEESPANSEVEAPFAEERRRLTYNTYHCIKALKDAFARLGIEGATAQSLKEAIFLRNVLAGVLGEGPTGE